MPFSISSPAFKHGDNIPARYTADGQELSPELKWGGAPSQTAGLALTVHDPDAPRAGGFTHWIVFNLPADSTGIPENAPRQLRLDNGATQGKNDFGGTGYMGPSPPPGKPHHYHFTLYALDAPLKLAAGAGYQQVQNALKGHILAETELVGLYHR